MRKSDPEVEDVTIMGSAKGFYTLDSLGPKKLSRLGLLQQEVKVPGGEEKISG